MPVLRVTCGALLGGAASALLLISPLCAQEHFARYESDFGPLALVISEESGEVTGEYPNYSGRVVGRYDHDASVVEATWIQAQSEVRCDSDRNGSHHWGRVSWELDAGHDLSGRWGYCEQPLDHAWNAQKLSGTLFRPVEEKQGTSEDSSGAAEITEQDVYGVLRQQWGQYAHLSEHQIIAADFTCNGAVERAIGWHDLDNPEGPFYRVMLVVRGPGGAPKGHTVTLVPDSEGLDGLQRLQGELDVMLMAEEISDDALAEMLPGRGEFARGPFA
ncbi:hypothetical protein [Fodinicurvata halophila]|uniref:hypothetical protein n=1 Tax=Fodinicurvata halophila TaxID=1419723 RepID=UPI003625D60A